MSIRSLLRLCVLALLLPLAAGAEPQAAQDGLPEAELIIAGHRMTAEVARSEDERETGLMFRRMLPEDRGMLFVFDPAQKVGIWMKNTYLPLSVAFLDKSGAVINIADMQPQTLDVHYSARMASYALEANAGWFKRHGIRTGTVVQGLAALPPAR